ncbi:MAG TPA: CRTAC1 family protein [Gemmataceae bacterium]|nr:CRTAC1 family protein [Gemmataceae bacterium]
MPSRTMTAVLAVVTGLAVGSLACNRTPNGQAEPAAAPPWFEDVTDAVGLNFTHDCGPTGTYFMPQSMYGGAALFDADGDGRLDVLLLQGAGPNTGVGNRLYLQTPDGKFRDASAGSGLDFDGYNVGVAIGDVDNDGRPDVLITQFVGARLLHNEGGGKFRDITAEAGLANPLWGASAAFVDYDRDGRLDLIIVNYLDYDKSWPCNGTDGTREFCGPRTFPGTVPRLFHNLGPGDGKPVRFADVTVEAGLATKAAPGLGVYAADLTGDGWPDLLITNDGTPNHLWVNQADGKTFKNEAMSRGIALTANGLSFANMGIAVADYDGDGLLDIFVTHLGSETHTLWRQGPLGQFRDRTQESQVVRTAWRGTGFGAVAADFDRDGWPDIAFVNGRIHREKVLPGADHLPVFWQPYAERNQLLRNAGGGQFEDASEAHPEFCGRPNVARGLAVGDFDNDGRPDLLVVSVGDRARLYRNVAPGGHWVGVRVTDPAKGNRDLLGTVVRVTAGGRTWVQVAQSASSYLSASDPRPLFGLGGATAYDRIEVTWPNGTREAFPGGPADRWVGLTPGSGNPL